MGRPVIRRPWTVVAAVVATVVHVLLLVFGVLGAIGVHGGPLVYPVSALAVLVAHWMYISALSLGPGAAKARRNGLAGTATAAGLELLCLGAFLYDELPGLCSAGGRALSNAAFVPLEAVLLPSVLFLGGATILLLRTRSATVYLRAA
ncbi:hypothetical protein [Actinocorallia populi]|uniref:hypothetical protein n=1 Tax=Actinocorallia populi TaxID=2079200 RepID=UPI000D097D10|nr:hypothetical protein [Actinocorallia populi]